MLTQDDINAAAGLLPRVIEIVETALIRIWAMASSSIVARLMHAGTEPGSSGKGVMQKWVSNPQAGHVCTYLGARSQSRTFATSFRPDSERARALITYWSTAYAGSFVGGDVTGSSGLGDSLAAMGLVEVDSGVTMARNGVPAQDESVKQFAIVNQALC